MAAIQILIAGFGGQGILFAGKFLAYKGLMEERQVSWLPSYGPEMRGGTASCSVILSDEPVGSPIVSKPDVLMVMNLPSLDRYEDAVKPGGIILVDSTLIERQVARQDVQACYVPATRLASDHHMNNLANMILTGKLLTLLGQNDDTYTEAALEKVVSARRPGMKEQNLQALRLGAQY